MVREAMKNYLALASGLTEVTRQRARAAARALVNQGEAIPSQVSGLADDLIQTSRSNRDALLGIIRYEIERTMSRVGVASSDEVQALSDRVRALEEEVRDLRNADAGAKITPARAAEPARPVKAAAKSGSRTAKSAKSAKSSTPRGAGPSTSARTTRSAKATTSGRATKTTAKKAKTTKTVKTARTTGRQKAQGTRRTRAIPRNEP